MSVIKAQDCPSMDEVRVEIDRIDKAIVTLMAERFTYVDRAWQLKDNPEDAVIPWRIQEVIDKVRAHAEDQNVPPELAETVYRHMIDWFIAFERGNLEDKA